MRTTVVARSVRCRPATVLHRESRAHLRRARALKRIGADDFPVVVLAQLLAFIWWVLHEFLDVAAGPGRRVEKQHAAGVTSRVLPGMRDVAREERAGSGPTNAHIVPDSEGDLAGEHPGHLVAVAMEMEHALGAGGHGFLEHHDALVGVLADHFQGGEATGRSHLLMLPAARGHDEAFCRAHVHVLPCCGMRMSVRTMRTNVHEPAVKKPRGYR